MLCDTCRAERRRTDDFRQCCVTACIKMDDPIKEVRELLEIRNQYREIEVVLKRHVIIDSVPRMVEQAVTDRAALLKERNAWKSNHDHQVEINRQLRRRPDLIERVTVRKRDCLPALGFLLDCSCWFDFTPLPDDLYAFSVKPDAAAQLRAFLGGLK